MDYYKMYNSKDKRILDKHYKNIDKIKKSYSVCKTRYGVKSDKMNRVISLCKKDIKLAPAFVRIWKKDKFLGLLPHYYTFSRLASIYEQRGEYEKALSVCKKSCKLKLYDDDTEGGIVGRMERIKKKMALEGYKKPSFLFRLFHWKV